MRPTPPIAGVGGMPVAHRLVVERHVAGDDGKVERPRGLADALDAADQFAHRLGALGIAEIEIVGERERPRADGDQIAPRFRHRLFSALARIGVAIALGAVGRQRQALRPVAEPHHRGVAAGALDRIAEDQRVVLLGDPALGAKIGRAEELDEGRVRRHGRHDRGGVENRRRRGLRPRAGHRAAPRCRVP